MTTTQGAVSGARPVTAEPTGDSIVDLTARLHGGVLVPGAPGYDERRRTWNGAYDRHPALIVQAADPADVIRAVSYARERELRLAVRGGGHSMTGQSSVDGGLVVDLGPMRRLTIDPAARVAWAEAGLTAGEYTAQAHAYGLATPFGDTGSVGIAGLTLGGGIGWLVRKHGLTIDHLLSAEIVTADGRLVVASENDNPELFWAIRGGGGNFGVVTAFQYRLVEVGDVFGGALLLPPSADVLEGFAAVASAAPDELTTIATVMAAPPAPFVPADQQGKPVFAVLAVHAGDVESGDRTVAPLRELATPVADTLGPIPYPAIYQYTAAASESHPGMARSMFLSSLDRGVAEIILEFMARATSPMAMAQIRILGGAMTRVPDAATAFAHRDKAVMLTIITPFVGPAPESEHRAWTEEFHAALRARAEGVYVNFLGDEGEARIREAYPDETYARLAAVKREFDPDNLFRLNQNIQP